MLLRLTYILSITLDGLHIMTTPLERKRKEKGLTIEQVASSIGCAAPNYWRIESGTQQPRKKLLLAIVRFFDDEVTEMEILFPEQFADESEFDDLEGTKGGGTNAKAT